MELEKIIGECELSKALLEKYKTVLRLRYLFKTPKGIHKYHLHLKNGSTITVMIDDNIYLAAQDNLDEFYELLIQKGLSYTNTNTQAVAFMRSLANEI